MNARACCKPFAGWLGDLAFLLICANLVAATLGIAYLNSPNIATGGDTASHILYAKLYADGLLFAGHILPWVPEVFGGFPFLSYYFPLPFIMIALLAQPLGFAAAFKWGAFLAAMLLPGSVALASRRWLAFSWPAALFAGLGAFAFLLHEQNSIWGGNLLSTLAGEFSYSYGMLFAVLAMLAWARAIHAGRGWVVAALFEAACGFSHGFPLLVVGFSTALLLLDAPFNQPGERWPAFRRAFLQLLYGHALAFALLGGWLWPMLQMHSLTIPNDASFPLGSWRDLLPATLWPVLAGGLAGLLLLALPSVRRGWSAGQRLALCYLISAAGLSAVAFLAGDQLGLADIRFFPPVWLLGAIACGWLAGQAVHGFCRQSAEHWRLTAARGLLTLAAASALIGWVGSKVHMAPDWGLWNHAGLEAKPQWHNLSQLFPVLEGNLWSPRLSFEHDPANNDIGSTRTLEALPTFLKQRPVLEGLYMESGVLGPAVYQVQSEISASPSSPLVRFPSGSLDPELAARHLNFLHADTILLRSQRAREQIEKSGHFVKLAEAPPFAVYRVKQFDSQLAAVVTQPIRFKPRHDWMQDAFGWFRTRSRFEAYLPVYADTPPTLAAVAKQPPAVREVELDRHRLVFATEAIGQPHLIKVAYHPRWQLRSQGSLHVAGPGFMLVVPQEAEIRLEFGHTGVGQLGILATCSALLIALVVLWRTRHAVAATPETAGGKLWWPLFGAWLALAALGSYYGLYSPERVYKEAWDAFNTSDDATAARKFQRAFELRRPPAKKEEALFWLAKTQERAGLRAEAKATYRQIFEQYHGYWIPESLYTYIALQKADGNTAELAPLIARLREEYPNNPWTLRLDQKP